MEPRLSQTLNHLMRRFTWPLTTLILFMTSARESGRAEVFLEQFWPETDFYMRMTEKSRLFFLVAGTRTKVDGYSDGQLGAHVDLFVSPVFFKRRVERHPDIARNRFLQLRVGYLFGRTPKDRPNPFVEHTPTVEATPRHYLPKGLLLTDRNRVDFRFVDGSFLPRYRNRLKAERSLGIKRFSLTPYAYAEAFYDWRYDRFHRFRFAAGGELEVRKWLVLEGYYLRQQDTEAEPRGTNIAGLAVQFYIR
jgi:hypothetical protein